MKLYIQNIKSKCTLVFIYSLLLLYFSFYLNKSNKEENGLSWFHENKIRRSLAPLPNVFHCFEVSLFWSTLWLMLLWIFMSLRKCSHCCIFQDSCSSVLHKGFISNFLIWNSKNPFVYLLPCQQCPCPPKRSLFGINLECW